MYIYAFLSNIRFLCCTTHHRDEVHDTGRIYRGVILVVPAFHAYTRFEDTAPDLCAVTADVTILWMHRKAY